MKNQERERSPEPVWSGVDRRSALEQDRRKCFSEDAMDREVERRHQLARRLNEAEVKV